MALHINKRRLVAGDRTSHPFAIGLRDRIALSAPVLAIGQLHIGASSRQSRPWLAMVAVPLLMIAAMLLLLWWTWPPLIVCAWWWAERSYRWTWFVAAEAALVGTQWAFAGVFALADFPDERLLIATAWIGFALALAIVSAANRRRNGAQDSYPGY